MREFYGNNNKFEQIKPMDYIYFHLITQSIN